METKTRLARIALWDVSETWRGKTPFNFSPVKSRFLVISSPTIMSENQNNTGEKSGAPSSKVVTRILTPRQIRQKGKFFSNNRHFEQRKQILRHYPQLHVILNLLF